ncbi:MAG: VOC family protein [Pseudomonadota bacterium]
MHPEWPFSTFHHIHIVVPDLEKTKRFLGGIGLPLQNYTHHIAGAFTTLEGITQEEFDELGYAFADIGGVHLQFMSPGALDSPHKRFIEANGGPRLFSAGFVVSDVDAAEQALVDRGLSILIKGRHENGWGFTYFDTIARTGFNICVRQSPKGKHSHEPIGKGEKIFSEFQHVCGYVPNLSATRASLTEIGLSTEGYNHRHEGDFKLLQGLSREAFWNLGYEHVMVGRVHFQIMSPGIEPSPQKSYVDAYGPRAYSIGFYVEDTDDAERQMIDRGLTVAWKGRHQNGWGFSYFDTFKDLGVMICLRQSPKG